MAINREECILLLKSYRYIKRYNKILESEKSESRYNIDSHIFAAFKQYNIPVWNSISLIHDYCVVMEKTLNICKKSNGDKLYYNILKLLYFNISPCNNKQLSAQLGLEYTHIHRKINKAVELFRTNLEKQLIQKEYCKETVSIDNIKNINTLLIVVTGVATEYKKYFKVVS